MRRVKTSSAGTNSELRGRKTSRFEKRDRADPVPRIGNGSKAVGNFSSLFVQLYSSSQRRFPLGASDVYVAIGVRTRRNAGLSSKEDTLITVQAGRIPAYLIRVESVSEPMFSSSTLLA